MNIAKLCVVTVLFFPPVANAQVSDAIAAAQLRTAEANAEAAASAAEEAKHKAAASATAAKFGPLASHSEDGSVEVGANSGKFEAALLSSRAIEEMAEKIQRDVLADIERAKVSNPGTVSAAPEVLVVTSTEMPTFDGYDAFKARVAQLDLEFAKAKVLQPKAKEKAATRGTKGVGGTAVGSAAVAIDVIGNLFRSAYKVAPLDVTPDDVLLVRAVVSALEATTLKLYVPSYTPSVSGTRNPAILSLEGVMKNRKEAQELLEIALKNAKKNPKLDYSLPTAALEGFIKSAETFAAEMRTPVAGVVPIVEIAKQARIQTTVESGYILSLKVHAAGGTSVAKKNFWTFFGGMPFKVSGGALVSYSLLDGSTGAIKGAGTFRAMEPLQKLTRIDVEDASKRSLAR